MTRIYVPVLIETVEQAEQLPDGTIAFVEKPWGNTTRRDVATKDHSDWWGSDCDINFLGDEGMVGWTALVPVEAEEEAISVQNRGQAHPDWRTRLTTPWKWIDGPSRDRRGDCA